MTRRILVTDGEERAALALTRAFGLAGHQVFVGATTDRALAAASRYSTRRVLLPDPLGDQAGFGEAVVQAVRRLQCDTVIPTTEAALYSVLAIRDAIPDVLVPFADLHDFRRLSDKATVTSAAPAAGIAIPRQIVVHQPSLAAEPAPGPLTFPVVIKPTRSVATASGGARRFQVSYATDFESLRGQLSTLPRAAYPVLIQERIVGPGIGVFCLLWDGELKAAFAHRRLREKPPSGGVSVYRESVALDPDLLSRSVKLLERFNWRGVAMVEYKVEARSGMPYLMEINGRFWGSLQLALDAGVDFPNLLLRAAMGEPTGELRPWRLGVRSRWWWGDVDHLLARLFGPADVQPYPRVGSKAKALTEFLKLWRPGDRGEILRLSDPRPFFTETANWFRALGSGRARSNG